MDYNPSLVRCGRIAKQTVRVVLALGKYRAEQTVDVRGNCLGMEVISSAVSALANGFRRVAQTEFPEIEMVHMETGTVSCCETWGSDLESWIEAHVICVEITAIEPEEEKAA